MRLEVSQTPTLTKIAAIVSNQNEVLEYVKGIKKIEELLGAAAILPKDFWQDVTVTDWELSYNLGDGFDQVAEEMAEYGESPNIIVDRSKKIQQIISEVYTNNNLLLTISPREFEEMIAELLRNQGFEVELTKQTRDGGYDIIALKYLERHQPIKFLVECKRYAADRPVGIEIVRSFKEVIMEHNANRGIIAATSYFTKDAKLKQEKTPYLLDFKDKDNIIDWVRDYKL